MKIKNKELVSIGVLTYNQYENLKKCLNYIISQDYENIEIIISDNSEINRLPKDLENIIYNDSRIRYYKQPHNIGEIKNTYFVKSKFKGEYACLLHDDDQIPTNYISKLFFTIKNSNNCVLTALSTDRYYNDKFWYSYKNINTTSDDQFTRINYLIKHIFCSGGLLEYFWSGLYKVRAHPENFKMTTTGSVIFFIFQMSIKGNVITVNENKKMIKNTSQINLEKYSARYKKKYKIFKIHILNSLYNRLRLLLKIIKPIISSKNIKLNYKIKILFKAIYASVRKCNCYTKEKSLP